MLERIKKAKVLLIAGVFVAWFVYLLVSIGEKYRFAEGIEPSTSDSLFTLWQISLEGLVYFPPFLVAFVVVIYIFSEISEPEDKCDHTESTDKTPET